MDPARAIADRRAQALFFVPLVNISSPSMDGMSVSWSRFRLGRMKDAPGTLGQVRIIL